VRFDAWPSLPRTVERDSLMIEVETAIEAGRTDEPSANSSESMRPSSKPRSQRTTRRRTESVAEERSGPGAPASSGSAAVTCDRFDVRQTLEAMRMGVVPSRHVADYTVGRDTEIEDLERLLRSRRGFRAIWGDYGAGKTHLLDLTESLAREQGFATSRIVIDPFELPPTHPRGIYRAIVQGLRLPAQRSVPPGLPGPQVAMGGGLLGGIDELASMLCESEQHRLPTGSAYSQFLSPYLHVLHAQDADAIAKLQDYVAGDDVERPEIERALRRTRWQYHVPLVLSDFRTYGRLYMLLLGTIAAWLEDAGYRGLVLLLDEVEHIDRMDRAQLHFAVEVLKHFAAIALPSDRLAFDPDDPADLYRGGHEAHRRLPLRFRHEQPLSIVCALTPLPEVDRLYRLDVADHEASLFLRRLTARDRQSLIERVEALYRIAYPGFEWPSSERTKARTYVLQATDEEDATVRRIVQRAVLVMDEYRYRGRSWDGA
jgi:hypothetical protein